MLFIYLYQGIMYKTKSVWKVHDRYRLDTMTLVLLLEGVIFKFVWHCFLYSFPRGGIILVAIEYSGVWKGGFLKISQVHIFHCNNYPFLGKTVTSFDKFVTCFPSIIKVELLHRDTKFVEIIPCGWYCLGLRKSVVFQVTRLTLINTSDLKGFFAVLVH